MSLRLAKNNTSPYDYVSIDGDMNNPIICHVVIDKSGGTTESQPYEVYLVATDEGDGNIGSYSEIEVEPDSSQEGITWEISQDGQEWAAKIEPDNMDVTEADQVEPVFVRVVADNSETTPLVTDNYAANIPVQGQQNPPEL